MAHLILSLEGKVVAQVELRAARTSLGRHPENDIVLAHRTVSARHAVVLQTNGAYVLEDLGSTNGSYVNGKRVTRQLLADGDRLVLAAYHLDFAAAPAAPAMPAASITVNDGPHAGRVLQLDKPLTTLGSSGAAVVAIARTADGYTVAHVDGGALVTLNGIGLTRAPRMLEHGNVINIAGTSMSFSVASAPERGPD